LLPLAQPADDGAIAIEPERDTTTSEAPSIPDSGTVVYYDDLRPGDCFNDSALGSSGEVAGEIRRVGCASPHDGEVFARATLPGTPGAAYPGDDEVDMRSEQLCLDGFGPYVGTDYLDSRWDIAFYMPSEASWYENDRLVICALGDPALNKTEGSKRDSGT
jgi:hypothetical protein